MKSELELVKTIKSASALMSSVFSVINSTRSSAIAEIVRDADVEAVFLYFWLIYVFVSAISIRHVA